MPDNEFGFLRVPLEGKFSGITLAPLDDHAERLHSLTADSNIDGYYYPPQITAYSTDTITGTERPASLFYLPASHSINIESPVARNQEPCTDEALIVYLLAYLYGTRLQPSAWKFDGRVLIKEDKLVWITETTTLDFLAHVYNWWSDITEQQRKKFVNVLYTFTRARSLEWKWDQFLHQYMVFDALYNLHLDLKPNSKKAETHKLRLRMLCNEYSIFNDEIINQIYDARNDLFHEAIWVESTIGFSAQDTRNYELPHYLSELNARIICGITGYKNEYTLSPWWSWQLNEFDSIHSA